VEKPFLTENIFPGTYLAQTGIEPQILFAIAAFIFGILLVFGIERTANYLKKS
jgi:putative membrane protein